MSCEGKHVEVFTLFEGENEGIASPEELVILLVPLFRTKGAKYMIFGVFEHHEGGLVPLHSVVEVKLTGAVLLRRIQDLPV